MSDFFITSELNEYDNGNSYNRLAARFLAKEIILGQLNTGNDFSEISILNDRYGKPLPEFTGKTAAAIRLQGLKKIHLSLSHSKKLAAAFVIFEYFYTSKR